MHITAEENTPTMMNPQSTRHGRWRQDDQQLLARVKPGQDTDHDKRQHRNLDDKSVPAEAALSEPENQRSKRRHDCADGQGNNHNKEGRNAAEQKANRACKERKPRCQHQCEAGGRKDGRTRSNRRLLNWRCGLHDVPTPESPLNDSSRGRYLGDSSLFP